MTIIFYGNDFKYEAEAVTKLFFPAEHFNFLYEEDAAGDKIVLRRSINKVNSELSCEASISGINKKLSDTADINDCDFEHICEQKLCRMLFLILTDITGIKVPWGLLTGIRPVKRVNTLLSEGLSEYQIKEHFKKYFFVSEEKTALALKTAEIQKKFLTVPIKSFSLYISIPFCPTRCSYCSFVSHSVQSAKKLIPEYVKKLCEEIKLTAEISRSLGLKADTIYIGGGTPTSISAEDLNKIMEAVSKSFDLSSVREYTVEAGRADTITEEKLKVIKNNCATRISINPQTMNNNVLKTIGRNHTAEQTAAAYNTARRLGFGNINMDLIAGLPSDNYESFQFSVNKLIELAPENITVHTLSLKRSSTLYQNSEAVNSNTVSDMIIYANKVLISSGYDPYYLYRQKNTLGNLENSGYSKAGFESLYNIFIMEEIQSILAVGAAASTKLIDSGRLKRIYNYKFPYEYISRYDEIIKRKNEIINFYNGGR